MTGGPQPMTSADPPVRVLLDESGNNDGQALLLVGALTSSRDFSTLEQQVQDAFDDFAARRDLRGLPSFEHFLQVGFHAAEDPREIEQAFFDEISGWMGFKTFLVASDRSRLTGTDETQRLLELYRVLLPDVLLRLRNHDRVELLIEQNEQLRPHLPALATELPDLVRRRAPTASVPAVTAEMVAKRNPHALSVLDYVMAACARWLKAGRPRDPRTWSFRRFLAVQPSISMLYSLEDGLISNRKHRVVPSSTMDTAPSD